MKNWFIYRMLLHALPAHGDATASTLSADTTRRVTSLLRKHRCVGASLCLFDEGGEAGALSFGQARPGVPALPETIYRAASVSKFVTALCAMKLSENGVLSLDADTNRYLPFSLRHPQAKDAPITLRMLLSHTAGLHDGAAYNAGVAHGEALGALLAGDSFTAHLPGGKWEYSNLGAGIAGAVMEAAAQCDFETLMQQTLFAPLDVTATFYPQKVAEKVTAQGAAVLADARRILPPARRPNFDAQSRRARPLPTPCVDAEHHYALAHGNLCVSVGNLAKLGVAGMVPGFLTAESLQDMRRVIAPFGERAHNLSEGVGTFILRDASIAPRPIYGHQGMAYGAVHGLFFDPAAGRGLALLTAGASEARRGVLADLNAALIRLLLSEGKETKQPEKAAGQASQGL